MKRAPLLLIAMIPFMAAAGDKQSATVDQEKLRSAVPVTRIVGQDVRTRDGRELGEIESVAFQADGSVAYYEIEPEREYAPTSGTSQGEDEPADNAATSMGGDDVASHDIVGADREATTAAGNDQSPVEGDSADDAAIVGSDIGYEGVSDDEMSDDDFADDEMIWITPDQVSLEGSAVVIDQDPMAASDGGARPQGAIRSDELVGMQVDLADAESFGEVEDVMISQDGKEAVALVVDNWDGANKERRALPARLQSVNMENESIQYDFGRDALSETGNFELEQQMDDM